MGGATAEMTTENELREIIRYFEVGEPRKWNPNRYRQYIYFNEYINHSETKRLIGFFWKLKHKIDEQNKHMREYDREVSKLKDICSDRIDKIVQLEMTIADKDKEVSTLREELELLQNEKETIM